MSYSFRMFESRIDSLRKTPKNANYQRNFYAEPYFYFTVSRYCQNHRWWNLWRHAERINLIKQKSKELWIFEWREYLTLTLSFSVMQSFLLISLRCEPWIEVFEAESELELWRKLVANIIFEIIPKEYSRYKKIEEVMIFTISRNSEIKIRINTKISLIIRISEGLP